MPVHICSLNSGSNANCYYVGNESEAILIDAGLSLRETEKRMRVSGLSMEKIKAIFISHEHIDRITGLPAISKKYQIPVYITQATLQNCKVPVEAHLVNNFSKSKPVKIGNLSVLPFPKHHDAADPHSFVISSHEINVLVLTDLGYACKQVIKHFSSCDVAILESNYCSEMLASGNYPYHLQKRISGDDGHLSNSQALEILRHYRSPALQLLILGHLSKNNNHPDKVEKLFLPHINKIILHIASRNQASPVFSLEAGSEKSSMKKTKQQLSLF